MPATTQNYELPYPLETDPISEGATTIQELAEKLDSFMRNKEIFFAKAFEAGGVGNGKTYNVNFPGNRVFKNIPKVEICSLREVLIDNSGKFDLQHLNTLTALRSYPMQHTCSIESVGNSSFSVTAFSAGKSSASHLVIGFLVKPQGE